VVTASNGLMVKLADNPAAITTIMVSPIAREAANKIPPIIPGKAAGIINFHTLTVVDWQPVFTRQTSVVYNH